MRTLSGPGTLEEVIKRSRFIAHVAPVRDESAAEAWMAAVRDPDATHNCWAWKVGERHRYSDDGEPGGTAGRPIFTTIERSGLDRVAVLVVRYFGGIKLGAGGLVRAYGGTAAKCLRETPQFEVVPRTRILVEVSFSDTGSLYGVLDGFEVERLEEEYAEHGLRLTLRLASRAVPTLDDALREATAARATLTELETEELPE